MSKRSNKFLVPAGLAVGLAFLTACGTAVGEAGGAPAAPGNGSNNASASQGAAGNAVLGGELVWVTPSAPVSLDPTGQNDSASSDARMSIFEGLVRFNPHVTTIDLEPALATSWGNVDDYTWYFNIRQGVVFHDGAELDAHAVARSLNRSVSDVAAPGHFIVDMITEVVAVDDWTVHITTAFPFAPLPGHLTHSIGGIVSPLAIDREEAGLGYINEHPVGTGPFEFVYLQGDEMLLRAVDNHWRQAPYVDYLRFWAVPESATRFALLQTGEVHVGNIPPTDFASANAENLSVLINDTTSIDYLGFNTSPGHVLSDVRIRQGIMHAINRADFIEFLVEGFGIYSHGFLSPMVEHSPTDLTSLSYDPARAAELLSAAGIDANNRITLNYWFNEGNPLREQVGLFVQAAVAPLGIDVSVTSVPWATYLEHTGQGLHDMFMLGWVTVTGDADYGLFPIFHSQQMGDAGNRFFFSNPAVDAALEEGRMSSDPAVRAAAYRRATELINYYVPAVPLRFTQQLFAYNNITGLSINFANSPAFYQVQITE